MKTVSWLQCQVAIRSGGDCGEMVSPHTVKGWLLLSSRTGAMWERSLAISVA